MRKLFFDTEFTGLHQNTTLISLGIVSDNDREFYAEFTDYDQKQVTDWVRNNVIPNLILNKETVFYDNTHYIGAANVIRHYLTGWLKSFNDELEMWSDCLAYDWVLFNQIWEGAMLVPEYVYYIPFDICTLFKIKGIDPDISREEFVEVKDNLKKHNALWDARIIRACYRKLVKL